MQLHAGSRLIFPPKQENDHSDCAKKHLTFTQKPQYIMEINLCKHNIWYPAVDF